MRWNRLFRAGGGGGPLCFVAVLSTLLLMCPLAGVAGAEIDWAKRLERGPGPEPWIGDLRPIQERDWSYARAWINPSTPQYDLPLGVYNGMNRAFRTVLPLDQTPALVDLVGMLKGAGVETAVEAVDYLSARFLRTVLDERDRDSVIELLRGRAGGDTRGTDHGVASPMFLVGKHVKGGFYSEHPSLKDLYEGDLKMTTDFRSVYATAIKEWMKHDDAESVLKGDFPTLGVFG